MKVQVTTFAAMAEPCPDNQFDCIIESKETELAKPGNIKWLSSHIKWAARQQKAVTIRPIL